MLFMCLVLLVGDSNLLHDDSPRLKVDHAVDLVDQQKVERRMGLTACSQIFLAFRSCRNGVALQC